MDIDRYRNIEASPDHETYSFLSSGIRGDITKIVKFNHLNNIPNTYNLALGSLRDNRADFTETTDNGDRNQVLSTIFYIAQIFIKEYPDRKIFVRGRNEATTRLYRAAINHSYPQLIEDFFILGGIYTTNGGQYYFEPFIQNKQYDVFLFEKRR
jgi:hypothetical protein